MRNSIRVGLSLLTALLLAALAAGPGAGDEKKEDKGARRKGTLVGSVTARGENFVEVKADGEEKARKYVPRWVGGAPAQGGGFDKKMLATFRTLKVGDRVRLEWEFEERPRAVAIEVLKRTEPK